MLKRTILIAEYDADLARFLTTQCRLLGFNVWQSPDALHALKGAYLAKPALMILDLDMPLGSESSIFEQFGIDRKWMRIPIIVLSRQPDEATIRRYQLAGARHVTKGPKLWTDLATAICQCLSAGHRTTEVDDAGSPADAGDHPDGPDESRRAPAATLPGSDRLSIQTRDDERVARTPATARAVGAAEASRIDWPDMNTNSTTAPAEQLSGRRAF